MQAYNFCTPTAVYFGKGKINVLPEVIKKHGTRVLLVYGGGSIKKQGIYQKIHELLADCQIYELQGVEPNPRITSVRDGAQMCKDHNIEVILAAGGGSVLDCAKAIAAGAKYDGDPWDLVLDNSLVKDALPLCTILTLSATGSEFDWGAVISNLETNEKLALISDHLFPAASILDPSYTYSVSAYQTAAGGCDIMSHIFEQYFVLGSSIVNDGLCESIVRSVMINTKKALEKPDDEQARSELMWASSLACNGICSLGNTPSPWVCHAIEHELSGYYDITHGIGLAILTPRFMRYSLNDSTVKRFANFAVRVMDVTPNDDLYSVANEGIDRLFAFYEEIGVPMHLKDVGIDDKHFEAMAEHAIKFAPLDMAIRPLDKDDVVAILKDCL
ncbi:iron-containing alcohol dehydrogenase [Anaerobiospirillum thomasii]|uniref:NADH-dependent butanol dehydrogenase A n=1 Tax=Anaerobiospirillum thomasii TaxID=179995 RepID=A0A2X0WXV2_9GAMM|nr:iron-containing alcohol dehydrogenase [Anaerobiospirillum thomasii]SPT70361.1 NADH-dependent butanol dehydrogenase A [Anaerobiospirillum thomasii]